MAKIKIKDLSKGIKITEEELKQVRGGFTPPPIRKIPIKSPYGISDALSCRTIYYGSGGAWSSPECGD
jgi:natural product precursor